MQFNLRQLSAIAPSQMQQLFRLVLGNSVALIRKCGFTKNNGQPWVSYISKIGASCSHFLKKSLFSGYDISFRDNWAIVTDLTTGRQSSVKLDSAYCSCEDFKRSNDSIYCDHIKAVVKVRPELQEIADRYELVEPSEEVKVQTPEYEVGDRVRATYLVNGIKQRRLGVVTALSTVGCEVDYIVKFDGSAEHKRFEASQLERWEIAAVKPRDAADPLSSYRMGARSLKGNIWNWNLVQDLKSRTTPA